MNTITLGGMRFGKTLAAFRGYVAWLVSRGYERALRDDEKAAAHEAADHLYEALTKDGVDISVGPNKWGASITVLLPAHGPNGCVGYVGFERNGRCGLWKREGSAAGVWKPGTAFGP